MTPAQLHELAAVADLLDVKPYDKANAIDRMIADGRAEVTGTRQRRLTAKGERWLAGLR